jgi:signal transduction histidine kinase
MSEFRTLRGRLALAYAAALVAALIAFAALTLFVVDRTQRAALDDRLFTALRAVTAIADVHDGGIVLDPTDRRQFARIVGRRLDAAVLDVSGRPLVATTASVPPNVAHLAPALDDAPLLTTVRAGSETLRVVAVRIPRRGPVLGVAVVWSEFDEIVALDRRLALVFALAIAGFAVFAVLAGEAVAARGLRPLDALASVASEIEAHDLTRRLDLPPRDDELGRLCATFDRMLDRLEAAFARQRRFTSDASHELRAPLSVIRAEADLMLRRPRTLEEYERALRSIAAQADGLEALTRDLLAAARAEGAAPAAQRIDPGALAREAVAQVDTLARVHAVQVDVATELGDDDRVRADAAALRRAFVCVIHNALRYGRNGGTVRVRVERAGANVRFSVADEGPGFSENALAHATERFWRDDPARSHASAEEENRASGGAGLGLAIARATVEAAGGTLTLSNRPEGGALVVVEMPVD